MVYMPAYIEILEEEAPLIFISFLQRVSLTFFFFLNVPLHFLCYYIVIFILFVFLSSPNFKLTTKYKGEDIKEII